MRASSDLRRLFVATRVRLIELELLFNRAEKMQTSEKHLYISYLVIEFDNLFLSFMREFAISILGGTRTVSGSRVYTSARFTKEPEASAYILATINPKVYAAKGSPRAITKRDEPILRDPSRLRRLLATSNASNLAQIDRAISISASFFTQAPTLRNFFAHKNLDTAAKVANLATRLGVPNLYRAEELVCARVRSVPSPLFIDWTSELKIFVEECVQ